MPRNTGSASQNARDLALKLKLESELANKVKQLFKTIALDAKAHYVENSHILDPRSYNVELNGILRNHYRKVTKAFENRLRIDIQKCLIIPLETKAIDDAINNKLRRYIYERSIAQTNTISDTTTTELNTAFKKAATDPDNNDPLKIALEATETFTSRAVARAFTIGLTETQNVAEKAKDIEAASLFEDVFVAGGVELSPESMTKTWSSILDDRTRDAHVVADDQTVSWSEPFIVMNEELMFPGDDSRGASLENIINCRCNTTRALDLSGLPDYVLRPENRAPRRGEQTI